MPPTKIRTEPGISQNPDDTDPVLLMLGVGKQMWEKEPGDIFVERLRSETVVDPPSASPGPNSELQESVWRRIQSHQGKEFQTATGLPLTYEVEGAGIWFFREGRRINRKLARAQVQLAIARCPLTSTTEIKDLMDYAYLFALLRDPRIRCEDW